MVSWNYSIGIIGCLRVKAQKFCLGSVEAGLKFEMRDSSFLLCLIFYATILSARGEKNERIGVGKLERNFTLHRYDKFGGFLCDGD